MQTYLTGYSETSYKLGQYRGKMFSFRSMKNSLNYFVIGCRLLPYGDFDSDGIGVQLEDLNENLANLLILKQPEQERELEEEPKLYFSLGLKKLSKLLNNPYTKLIMKKLPYKDYFDNLIWEPPRRSFAFVKLAETAPSTPRHKSVEIGFGPSGLLMLASYQTGTFYQYKLPKPHLEDREECQLISSHSLE